MLLHIPTLFVVTVFVTALQGALLAASGLQNRSVGASAWWGAAYLTGAVGLGLIGARNSVPAFVSIDVSNALILASYGLVWSGARLFEGRRPRIAMIFIAPVLFLAACRVPAIAADVNLRIVLASVLMTFLAVAAALEFWRGRAEPLMSRWPVIVVLLIQAIAVLSRVGLVTMSPFADAASILVGPSVSFMTFGSLSFTVVLAFLLLNMTKERTELKHKIASLVDPLTGVANRRAFLSEAGAMIERPPGEREVYALFLFDLDHFKLVNDRFGHAKGDRALRAFAQTAVRTLGPDALFGRIGGEEFAAVTSVGDMGEAFAVADRVRRHFKSDAKPLGDDELSPTVSVGVTLCTGASVDGLLERADKALYRAKARGRDRVEATPPFAEFDALRAISPSVVPIIPPATARRRLDDCDDIIMRPASTAC